MVQESLFALIQKQSASPGAYDAFILHRILRTYSDTSDEKWHAYTNFCYNHHTQIGHYGL